MCGRIARERADYAIRFGFKEESETRLGYNIGPMQLDLMIRGDEDRRRQVASRWGLVPVWAKDAAVGAKMINARAETLLERPAFRGLVATRRCIIPASGFYEWRKTPDGKTPIYIQRADGRPLALAGLWSEWRQPNGTLLTSHTIITCAPNALMRAIHDRMPAILADTDVDAWLDPANRAPADLLPLLHPYAEAGLRAHAVAPLVNAVRNDGPELILSADGEALRAG